MDTPLEWRTIAFDEMSPRDLHDALRLRQDVFVVEQDCVFGEIDGRDPAAIHVLGRDENGRLVAYARVFEPGVIAAEASIGRVVTDPTVRGTGLGRVLMREAMHAIARIAPRVPIRLAARAHLEPFYASLGFEPIGEAYMEDGIVHQDMVRAAEVGAVTD